MVRTPLWTDSPDKMAQVGYSADESLGPDEVAKYMIELITQGKYPGGTSLEMSMGGSRPLGVWNIEPPAALGTNVPKEVIDKNRAPIAALLKKERGSHL